MLLKLADTSLILINPSPSNAKVLADSGWQLGVYLIFFFMPSQNVEPMVVSKHFHKRKFSSVYWFINYLWRFEWYHIDPKWSKGSLRLDWTVDSDYSLPWNSLHEYFHNEYSYLTISWVLLIIKNRSWWWTYFPCKSIPHYITSELLLYHNK